MSREFGGHQASPGLVESQYGLMSAVQRPQTTVFGRDAYPSFSDKAAAFLFALLQNAPFKSGNRRLALASLVAFCELNHRQLDSRALDEKAIEGLVKRAATYRSQGVPAENVFSETRELLARAIVPLVS